MSTPEPIPPPGQFAQALVVLLFEQKPFAGSGLAEPAVGVREDRLEVVARQPGAALREWDDCNAETVREEVPRGGQTGQAPGVTREVRTEFEVDDAPAVVAAVDDVVEVGLLGPLSDEDDPELVAAGECGHPSYEFLGLDRVGLAGLREQVSLDEIPTVEGDRERVRDVADGL